MERGRPPRVDAPSRSRRCGHFLKCGGSADACVDAPEAVVADIFSVPCGDLVCDGSQFTADGSPDATFATIVAGFCPVRCDGAGGDCGGFCGDDDALVDADGSSFGLPTSCGAWRDSPSASNCDPVYVWACAATAESCRACAGDPGASA